MKSIPIILNIINSIASYEVETNGILIQHDKKNYIVTLHQGLPITSIVVKFSMTNTKTYTMDQYTQVMWNDLLYIEIDSTNFSNLYVFKQVVKKQINVTSKYYLDDFNVVKYQMNDFFPINMIPGNPTNLYYKMISYVSSESNLSGKPIYDNKNRLIGLISKVEDKYLYIIPSIYIVKTFEKKDNSNIYSIDSTNLVKIASNNISKNNTIYSPKMSTRIPLECMIVFEGDIDQNIKVTYKIPDDIVDRINGISLECSEMKNIMPLKEYTRDYNFLQFTNYLIPNSYNINIIGNNIIVNSSFIHLIKTYKNNSDIIKMLFSNMNTKREIDILYPSNDTMYRVVWE